MSRKHKINHLSAIIKSKASPEFVLVFPELKNLHLEGVDDVQSMQSMIQMRFANLNSKDTLRIYATNDKSLSGYR